MDYKFFGSDAWRKCVWTADGASTGTIIEFLKENLSVNLSDKDISLLEEVLKTCISEGNYNGYSNGYDNGYGDCSNDREMEDY